MPNNSLTTLKPQIDAGRDAAAGDAVAIDDYTLIDGLGAEQR